MSVAKATVPVRIYSAQFLVTSEVTSVFITKALRKESFILAQDLFFLQELQRAISKFLISSCSRTLCLDPTDLLYCAAINHKNLVRTDTWYI